MAQRQSISRRAGVIGRSLVLAAAVAAARAPSARAQDAYFSTQGDFTANNARQDFYFDLTRPVSYFNDVFRFETFSSRGTPNSAGDSSPTIANGFDSILTLTNEAGTLIGSNDDGATGANADSLLSWTGTADSGGTLGTGPVAASSNYRLRLTEFNNLTGPWGIDLIGPANALKLRDFRPDFTPDTPSPIRSIKFGTFSVAAVNSNEPHAIFSPTIVDDADYFITGDLVVADSGNASFIMDDLRDTFIVGGRTTVRLGGDMQIMFDSVFNADGGFSLNGGRVSLTDESRFNVGSALQDIEVRNGGRIEVNAGTLLNAPTTRLVLGYDGNSTPNELVIAGGVVDTRMGAMGRLANTIGRATVSGSTGRWDMSEDLFVGSFVAQGSLAVTTGGKVTNRDGYIYNGTATITGEGSVWTNTGNLTLGTATNSSATLNLNTGGTVSAGSLFIDTTSGRIAMQRGSTLVIDYTGATPAATIRGYLQTGLATGNWTGNGIRLDSTDTRLAIGYTDNLTATLLTVKPALKGDTNLDNVVNFTDLLALAVNYNGTSKLWQQGDFNYDATVNFTDLLPLAANYNQTLTGSFEGDWALAQRLVPEPAALSLIVGSTVILRRRR
jgi:T5SS/PEP-CTERM-associated repeat protein